MADIDELDRTVSGTFVAESPPLKGDLYENTFPDEKRFENHGEFRPPIEWLERLKDEYGGHHEGESLPPGCDPDKFAEAIFTMTPDQSIEVLKETIANLYTDFSFDRVVADRIREMILGHEAVNLDYDEWSYQVCKMAGIIHNWSPYVEVRSCTLPYDDPEEPCETMRAYIVGFFWVIVITAVNSFFAPRQPGISIPNSLAQLLCVPMGRGLATIIPKMGFHAFGYYWNLSPGTSAPWSPKEQLFATVIFSGASTIGNFTGLLDLRLPLFFGQQWATFGFCLLVALSNQLFGLGAAGILRRLTVYPTEAIWPGNLPILALTRALVASDQRNEVVNGWKLKRMHMFGWCALIFGIYYWIPNQLLLAIRNFNWMTWIAPRNFNLAVVTGGYGGFGFNPISSLDPSTFGLSVSAPFFAQFQQYVMRVIGGIIILAMYYSNYAWTAYLPPNSNGVFDNQGKNYNYTKVINSDNTVNFDGYLEYGPPYYTVSNLFVTGGNFVYYTFSVVYVFIKYRHAIKKCFWGMAINMWKRQSIYTGFTDGATRMMRRYPEVPEWWYSIIFVFGFCISIASVAAFPTNTPVWSIVAMTGIAFVLTIPWTIVESVANTGISLGVIWQVLPGIWFPGNPLAQLMLLMYGGAFEQLAGGFTADLKYGVYARIPPRAIFRGHFSACVVNCIIYTAMVEVMIAYANVTGTLCEPTNPQFMVCAYAHSVYSSTVEFGAFGTNNMFKLYPVMPWCFLMGAVLGFIWVYGEIFGARIHAWCERKMGGSFATFDAYVWSPTARTLSYVHPAIAINGALQWSGNTNLTQITGGITVVWGFMYYIKRHYSAWWQKYTYLAYTGLSVGTTVSGLIVTLVFSFGAGRGKSLNWSGNTIARAGIDGELYNNVGSLLPIPEVGYFGLAPADYPTDWTH